jgi:hypothetical protein
MISPRDFVMLRYLDYSKDKDRATVYFSSIKCDKVPEVKGIVRAEAIFGGNILERIDENKTKLTLFSVVSLLLI